ncbi:uncharacterized protein LOC114580543 [Dendrobium catenatum]|uniref:uncharacterized protein LOC114580543 n=1 Tax=Dendrobium catenatum TaxID=906689 RepID=UPI0010A09958|nr:uncharacterized protein LOC114580543 [Dendrobium catenatum]
MADGQSASQAAPMNSFAPVVGSDTVSQFATLITQMMSETQNRVSAVRFKDVDRHLQMFLILKPPRFEGIVEPIAAKDWLRRLEKTFDGMQCPPDRKVLLAVFLLDGEAERWWMGQQQMHENFLRMVQGSKTVMQYEAEFTALARYAPQLRARLIENDLMATQQRWTATRKRFSGVTSSSGFFGKKNIFVSRDSKRSGQSVSATVSGSGNMASSGSVSGASSFVRPAGKNRAIPPRTVSEGSSSRAGGSGSLARRPPSGNQREPSSSVAPVQPRVYNLNQQEARDTPDVVTGTIYISEHPCRVLFDSGASHSFISERFFDDLQLVSVTLPVSLSIDCLKKQVTLFMDGERCVFQGLRGTLSCLISMLKVRTLWKKGCMVFLASVRDMNIDAGSISDIPIVRDFSDVFLEELVGLPLDRDVEFCINVFSGMAQISKAPYKMAPKELAE